MGLLEIMHRELTVKPIYSWQLSGVPTVLTYQLWDHLELMSQEIVDWYWGDEKQESAESSPISKSLTQKA